MGALEIPAFAGMTTVISGMTFVIYSLKTGACLIVFYLFFKLLLSRETFHRLNRIVILSAIILSFALPLCIITFTRELPAELFTASQGGGETTTLITQEQGFAWGKIATLLFWTGAGATFLWTIISTCNVVRIIRGGRRENAKLILTEQKITPFSWWRYIVLSESDFEQNGEVIIRHERAHIRLHHSADLLLADIALCLQWFNPAMWLLRRELRAIHEYEADKAVLESGVDAKEYQLLLIKKAVGGRFYSVANSFNHVKLKNRIAMMLCKKSSRLSVAKVLLVLPLMGLAMGAFARTEYVSVTEHVVTTNNTPPNAATEVVDNSKVYDFVEQMPSFPGGNAEMMKFLSSNVRYPADAEKSGISGTVVCQFTVDKDGSISNVKIVQTPDSSLSEEAIRIVNMMPKWIPGKQDGVAVRVRYNVPVAFRLQQKVKVVGPMQIDDGSLPQTAGTIKEVRQTKVVTMGKSDGAKPLLIVDGVVSEKSDIAEIVKADDIESVSVLKGSTAVEQYGEKGRDGVILITTKKKVE